MVILYFTSHFLRSFLAKIHCTLCSNKNHSNDNSTLSTPCWHPPALEPIGVFLLSFYFALLVKTQSLLLYQVNNAVRELDSWTKKLTWSERFHGFLLMSRGGDSGDGMAAMTNFFKERLLSAFRINCFILKTSDLLNLLSVLCSA